MMWWSLLVGVPAGIAVIYAATQVRQGGPGRERAGILGIVGGAVSFLAMGGYVIGGLAAIIGGVLALAGRAPREDRMRPA
jgi:hypothetical protein